MKKSSIGASVIVGIALALPAHAAVQELQFAANVYATGTGQTHSNMAVYNGNVINIGDKLSVSLMLDMDKVQFSPAYPWTVEYGSFGSYTYMSDAYYRYTGSLLISNANGEVLDVFQSTTVGISLGGTTPSGQWPSSVGLNGTSGTSSVHMINWPVGGFGQDVDPLSLLTSDSHDDLSISWGEGDPEHYGYISMTWHYIPPAVPEPSMNLMFFAGAALLAGFYRGRKHTKSEEWSL